MLADSRVIATIPVSDIQHVRSFYVDTLGLKLLEEPGGDLLFECGGGTSFTVFVSAGRASGDHTQMTFLCEDLDAEVSGLRARGVRFEEFDVPGATSAEGVYEFDGQRGAWFRDPEGNLLAVAQMPL